MGPSSIDLLADKASHINIHDLHLFVISHGGHDLLDIIVELPDHEFFLLTGSAHLQEIVADISTFSKPTYLMHSKWSGLSHDTNTSTSENGIIQRAHCFGNHLDFSLVKSPCHLHRI